LGGARKSYKLATNRELYYTIWTIPSDLWWRPAPVEGSKNLLRNDFCTQKIFKVLIFIVELCVFITEDRVVLFYTLGNVLFPKFADVDYIS